MGSYRRVTEALFTGCRIGQLTVNKYKGNGGLMIGKVVVRFNKK